MPSSWSASLRFELQYTGENINLWGDKLDVVLQHIDYTIAGWLTKALTTSPYSLTTANAADDEARAAMLKFTGTGAFTVTIPSVSKSYDVWNACTGIVTVTTGAGSTVAIDPGDIVRVLCDGTNVKTPGYGGYSTKDYITAQTASAGAVPGTTGHLGKFLKVTVDGSAPTWQVLVAADITDLTVTGRHELWVPASAITSRTTNGAAPGLVETTTNKVMLRTLDFDASTIEYGQFALRMPKSWNEGTVTAVFEWSHGSTTVNFKVSWGLQAVALSDDDAGDAAFGTAIYANDIGGTTNDFYASPETAAITIAGTPAANDLVVFQILRKADDATNDTLAIDARLHGVTLILSTDAGNDA